jgi:hypothetical protein
VKSRTTILYADADVERTRTITEALDNAGYRVFPCSGTIFSGIPNQFTRPDLVVLHAEIGEPLGLFVETVWPAVPYIVVNEPENIPDLISAIRSALRGARPN